ncbi:MAG: PAS domain S-box protein [Nitrospira sp.]|nr:PAS domain S-box protein [Nitrospira sp.]
MKVGHSLVMRVMPWAIPVLTIGIFIFDLLTPAGVGIPMLYVVPIVLTIFTPRERDSVYLCLLVTGLIWVELLFNPPGHFDSYVVLNRALGTFVVWSITLGLFRYKEMDHGLAKAETDKVQAEHALMSERVERAHAEGLMMAAQEARAYADTAASGASASRREAEERFLVSQLRLQSIIESAMDAIITVDQDQRVVLFNRAAEDMFGLPAHDAVGRSLDRFLPARFRDAHQHLIHAFGQSGVTSRKMGKLGTVMGLRSNGEEFPIEAAISHVTVGEKKYYTVILRDIGERVQVVEELRRQHEFIEAVLETAGALVVVLDRHGKILRFNRACEQTTGYSSEEAVGKTVWEFLLPPEEIESVKAVFGHLTGGEVRVEHENVWVTKDGRRRRIAWANTVIIDAHGRTDYVVATGIDVTELKQIQEQLRKTERIAELGTLASGMAHEIGTPMNVILGRAEYLMDRVKDEPIKKGLKTIIAQVERITKVMNQLLAFARRKPPERGPLQLKDIVENGLELFQERLEKSRVIVETALDDACAKVLADGDQMSQVFINLVMNAIHAMPDGGTLRVALAQDKDVVKLTVTDSGHGIPPEALPKIFEPFFTTKEFGQGTGLGLTVVKGIIEEHQGTVMVDSEEGKGTKFTILLPQSQ